MEAAGGLVAPTVFKTDVAEHLGQAGSIPARLRSGPPNRPTLEAQALSSDDRRRNTPRVDVILEDPRVRAGQRALGRPAVRALVNGVLDRVRSGEIAPEDAAEAVAAALPPTAASARRVINATGVLVHTNLGRAPLSAAARAALTAAAGSTDVEYDLPSGRRGDRGAAVRAALLAAVPEAAAVHVVNNNAAALALVVGELAAGREILLSRGEFVEVGDGFRIPELLVAAGARIREVGTTNRTRLSDYADAIGPQTALIFRIHTSNFAVSGFTRAVPISDLATLGLPVVHDVGSGLLRREPLLPDEPAVATSLAEGAALVTASADKLLGGPQAGLLFGREDLIRRLRRNPLARALRVDKLTLAALEATVSGPPPPVQTMLRTGVEDLRSRADRLVALLPEAAAVATRAAIGGGGAPGVELPSVAIALPASFAAARRAGDPPVVGIVRGDQCLLDLRTVLPEEDDELAAAVLAVRSGLARRG